MTDHPEAGFRRISPAKDRRVRHETGELLAPKTNVTWTPYWQRRLNDGDVVAVEPKVTPEKKD